MEVAGCVLFRYTGVHTLWLWHGFKEFPVIIGVIILHLLPTSLFFVFFLFFTQEGLFADWSVVTLGLQWEGPWSLLFLRSLDMMVVV